ncbi:MAG TPA: DUF6456 domain-containing protein [Microvirga sp.]
MNKKEISGRPTAAAGPLRTRRDSAESRSRARERLPERSVGGRAGEPLSREAARLLNALAEPTAIALHDPTDAAFVIVRKGKGVALSAGRFGTRAADALARHDLAQWSAGGGAAILQITRAGEAYRRRRAADDEPFLHQQIETETRAVHMPEGPQRVRVDAEESPLDWLRRRRDRDGAPLIDEAAFEAGERLRRDITLAGLLPGVTARWDGMPAGGGTQGPADATDRVVAARQRIRHAFEAVGADFSDLLLDLCGFLKGLETIERERRWPARSAKVVVRLALARLAEHYGLEAVARGPAASRGIRRWQAIVIEGGLAE